MIVRAAYRPQDGHDERHDPADRRLRVQRLGDARQVAREAAPRASSRPRSATAHRGTRALARARSRRATCSSRPACTAPRPTACSATRCSAPSGSACSRSGCSGSPACRVFWVDRALRRRRRRRLDAPVGFVKRKIRMRHDQIEYELPDLIDLLVVSIEAGLSFPGAMRLAADRIRGPLGQELRLTLQEQNMGLPSTRRSAQPLQARRDAGHRASSRARSSRARRSASRWATSCGTIADEMRKRRKAAAEEKAQKAPIKMLFPLVFLIFPAMFIVILLPGDHLDREGLYEHRHVQVALSNGRRPTRVADAPPRGRQDHLRVGPGRGHDRGGACAGSSDGAGSSRATGLLLRPAWSIHTAFMRFPIDVVFVDHDLIVIRIEHSMRPFKTASCRGAREVVELAAGECERRGLEVGDRVAWASRSAPARDRRRRPELAPAPDSKGNVLVASSDQRFVKVARFLLDGRGHRRRSADVRPDGDRRRARGRRRRRRPPRFGRWPRGRASAVEHDSRQPARPARRHRRRRHRRTRAGRRRDLRQMGSDGRGDRRPRAGYRGRCVHRVTVAPLPNRADNCMMSLHSPTVSRGGETARGVKEEGSHGSYEPQPLTSDGIGRRRSCRDRHEHRARALRPAARPAAEDAGRLDRIHARLADGASRPHRAAALGGARPQRPDHRRLQGATATPPTHSPPASTPPT